MAQNRHRIDRVSIFLTAFVLAALCGSCFGTTYTIAYWYAENDPARVGETVTVDASKSWSNVYGTSSLYFSYDFGDGTTVSPSQGTTSKTHTYSAAGKYYIRVFVSSTSASPYASSLNETASAQVLPIQVEPNIDCYQFRLYTLSGTSLVEDLALAQYSSVDLYIQVDYRGAASTSSATKQALTQQYYYAGGSPQLTFSNSSVVVSSSYTQIYHDSSGVLTAFKISVFTSSMEDVVSVLMSSNSVSSSQCGVATTTALVSVTRWSSTFGSTVSTASTELTAGNFQLPDLLNVVQDECNREMAIMPLMSTQTGTSIGGYTILTASSFGPYSTLTDLIAGTGSAYLCASSSFTGCSSLVIYSAVIIYEYVLFATSHGLLYYHRGTFSQLTTGIAALDNDYGTTSTTYTQKAKTKFYRSSRCTPSEYMYFPHSEHVFIRYMLAGDTTHSVAYTEYTGSSFLSQTWTSVSFSSSLGLGSLIINGIVRLQDKNTNLYLFGDSSNQNAKTVIQTQTSYAAVSSTTVGHTFTTSLALSGLAVHYTAAQTYVYGDSLWVSYDGGYSFRELMTPLGSSETIVSLTSTHYLGGVAALTSKPGILYFRASVPTVIPVKSQLTDESMSPTLSRAIIFDSLGRLYCLTTENPRPYSSSSSDYPYGLLADTSRNVRSSSSPMIKKVRVMVESAARAHEKRLDAPLAISGLEGRVQIYQGPLLWESTNGFTSSLVGRILEVRRGGRVKIVDVDTTAGAMSGDVIEAIVPEPSTVSPAVSDGIFPSAQTGNANFSIGTTGVWLAADVGKSILVNGGCAIITTWYNTTLVQGYIYQPLASYNSWVSTGLWHLVDMREYYNEANLKEGTTLTWSNTGLTLVLSNNNYLTFTSSDVGKIVEINDSGTWKWGVILTYSSGTEVVFRNETYITSGAYSHEAVRMFSHGPDFRRQDSLNVTTSFPYSTRFPAYYFSTNDCQYSSIQWSSWIIDESTFASDLAPHQIYGTVQHTTQNGVYTSTNLVAPAVRPKFVFVDYSEYALVTAALPVDLEVTSSLVISNMNIIRSEFSLGYTTLYGMNMSTVSITNSNVTGHGVSIVSMIAPGCSLSCGQCEHYVQFVAGCQPAKQIYFSLPFTEDQWVSDEVFLNSVGLPMLFDMPSNYRPPSKYGRGIPLSPHIYNGDPDLPRHYDYYQLSKNSGAYGHCAGKSLKSECACTNERRYSQFSDDSDCSVRALTTEMSSIYLPDLQLYIPNFENATFPLEYRITEVNGRDDFCFNSTSSSCGSSGFNIDTFIRVDNLVKNALELTRVSTGAEGGIVDPSVYDGIIFYGIELFHFKATVEYGSLCPMSTEFKVWVYNPPIERIWVHLVVSLTTYGLVLIFLLCIVESQQFAEAGVSLRLGAEYLTQRDRKKKFKKEQQHKARLAESIGSTSIGSAATSQAAPGVVRMNSFNTPANRR